MRKDNTKAYLLIRVVDVVVHSLALFYSVYLFMKGDVQSAIFLMLMAIALKI